MTIGPTPDPASHPMKNVELANPISVGLAILTQMDCSDDIEHPMPNPKSAAESKSVTALLERASTTKPTTIAAIVKNMTEFSPFLSKRRPTKGRPSKTNAAYTRK